MKRTWKKNLAIATVVGMITGSTMTGVAAVQVEWNKESTGKVIQRVTNNEQGMDTLCIVHLLPLGTVLTFDCDVDVFLYAEGEYGAYCPILLQENVSSFVVEDTSKLYVFSDDDGEVILVQGENQKQIPRTTVVDFENGTIVSLSKPVVDITIKAYETFWGEESTWEWYLVYQVPVGTTISEGGNGHAAVSQIWDVDGLQVNNMDEIASILEKDALYQGEDVSALPVTLSMAGYSFAFETESLTSWMPVLEVVDVPESVYEPRTTNFEDLDWSKPFVEKVYGYGWMEGTDEGTFAPERSLTVAEVLTLAARIHATMRNVPILHAEGEWYQKYVTYCLQEGLLSQENREWLEHLDETATRAQMVFMLDSAYPQRELEWGEAETVVIPDIDKQTHPYGSQIYNWYRAGIVSGDAETGAFRPDDAVTRGEMAVVLCHLLGL